MLHEPRDDSYALADDELADDRTLAVESPRDEEGDEEGGLRARLRRDFERRAWVAPVALFVVSAIVFALFSWNRLSAPSSDTHFVYLANTYNTMIAASLGDEEARARREGKVPFELDRDPPHRNDWASWLDLHLRDGQRLRGNWFERQGSGAFKTLDGQLIIVDRHQIDHRKTERRYFVSFPPGPAILMMPLAAIWGYAVNDVIFTIFFAALNVALMYLLLRRLSIGGRSGRSRSDNLWLTALFGFGTVHLWCSVLGQVWFTALVVGVTFTLLYAIFAIDARRPLLAGLAMAAAFSTRTPLLFTTLLFFGFVFFPGGRRLRLEQWRPAAARLALFCVPCLVVGLTLLWMNEIRFGSPTEFGHRYLAYGSLERIKRYGLFNFHFLSKNLSAMLTLLPRIQPEAPYVIVSKHGMSLLLTTPAFLYLLRPKRRESRADIFWHRALWLTVAACALPGLMYQNTGYAQFGYRFSLDYTPYLIALLAVGRHPLTWPFKACVLAGFAVNAFGAVTFKRFEQFYSEKFFV